MSNYPTRGHNRPKTYMFYITHSDKSFYDFEDPNGLTSITTYLVKPIAVNSLADAQLILDEIKQRSLVSCDEVPYTFRRRQPKPLSIKVFGYRYADQRKRVAKLKRKQTMSGTLAQRLYDTYADNITVIADEQYELCDNHIIPREDLVDFTETVFDILKEGGAR